MRKLLLVGGALVLLLTVGLYVWARSVLTGDAVRTAVAQQLSAALGQPVTIGGLSASVFPRVSMDLADVTVGKPARVSIRRLRVGTPLRALIFRRIEHADLTLEGARVQLPLPPLGGAGTGAKTKSASGGAPVTLVSIDAITLKDVEVTSGGRTVRVDADLALAGLGLTIRRLTLGADAARVNVTGDLSDLSGPVGRLTVRAGALDLPALAAFLSDFSGGAGLGASPAGAGAPGSALDLTMSLEADQASFGTLRVSSLIGQARATPAAITIDPIRFGAFRGTCDGTLRLSLGKTPTFRLKAKIAGLDVADAIAFAGNPGVITGRAAATLDLTGRGTAADQVIASTAGTARFDVVNGTIARLGLVRSVVVATSGRAGSTARTTSGSEAFTRLGATFAIGSGIARTDDLRFESPDVLLSAVGTVQLDGERVELSGPLQLSKELSDQAGRDLVRYTAKDGLVTVPITVTGPVSDLKVGVGLTDLARRAITNQATESIKKTLLQGLKKIIKAP